MPSLRPSRRPGRRGCDTGASIFLKHTGAAMTENSYDARDTLDVGGKSFTYYRLDALQSEFDVARLPFSLKVLLENVLRNEDGDAVRTDDIEALATWDAKAD